MSLILSGTDGLSDVDGSAATPAIRGTDANTGIFFPAADTIAFAEGGAESMRIDASGNLGIGNTNNSALLHVGKVNQDGDVAVMIGNGATSSFTASTATLQFRQGGNGGATLNAGKIVSGRTGNYSSSADADSFLAFYTALDNTDTERMRLDSSGNLLVGTTSAVATATRAGFYNAGSASPVVGVQNARNVSGDSVNSWLIGSNCQNTSSFFLTCGVSGVANVLYIYGNGNVQNTNNSYGAISDVKLKENIVDATPKLADLMQVKVRNFNLIGGTTKQIGVVAQELETIFPGLIDESPDYEPQIKTREVEVPAVAEVRDNEGNIVTEAVEATTKTEEYTEQVALGTTTKSVKYSVFVPMLIKAMQEQQALITQLTARITALESA